MTERRKIAVITEFRNLSGNVARVAVYELPEKDAYSVTLEQREKVGESDPCPECGRGGGEQYDTEIVGEIQTRRIELPRRFL